MLFYIGKGYKNVDEIDADDWQQAQRVFAELGYEGNWNIYNTHNGNSHPVSIEPIAKQKKRIKLMKEQEIKRRQKDREKIAKERRDNSYTCRWNYYNFDTVKMFCAVWGIKWKEEGVAKDRLRLLLPESMTKKEFITYIKQMRL